MRISFIDQCESTIFLKYVLTLVGFKINTKNEISKHEIQCQKLSYNRHSKRIEAT